MHDAGDRTFAPNARHGLLVGGWVPVRIDQDEARPADEVQPHAARLGREQEHRHVAGGGIEAVHKPLPRLAGCPVPHPRRMLITRVQLGEKSARS